MDKTENKFIPETMVPTRLAVTSAGDEITGSASCRASARTLFNTGIDSRGVRIYHSSVL